MAASSLILLRHAQSEWNAAGRWQGQADPPLSPLGRLQAAQLAEYPPASDISMVLSSDQQRARDTATPLAESLGLDLRIEPVIRELHVGTWEGRTRDEIGAEDPEALERFFQGAQGWSGGETYAQHHERACEFIAMLDGDDFPSDGTVVTVTHGATLRALVLELLQLDAEARWRLSGIDHVHLTSLVRGPHGWRLVAYNVAPWPADVDPARGAPSVPAAGA